MTRLRTVLITLTQIAAVAMTSVAGQGPFYPPRAMAPTYELGLHVVVTADDDGSNGPTLSDSQISEAIDEASQSFASAGIEFVFDPYVDLEKINSTLLNRELTLLADPEDLTDPDIYPPASAYDTASHHRARTQLADQHRDRITIFFRHTERWAWSESDGHWVVIGRGGSSSWGAPYVNMHNNPPGKNGLAHEIGHYLQNRHPFVTGVMTVDDAIGRIQNYIKYHPANQGLDALDGDRSFVRDTPADAAGSIYGDLGGFKCDPNGEINLDVPDPFNPSIIHSYLLDPDRTNIMSYYGGCPWSMGLSPDQIARTRDALQNGNRHRLISAQYSGFQGPLTLQGVVSAGVAGNIRLTRTRHRQLVTTLLTNSGKLKLIAWHADGDGNLTRRGDIQTSGNATRVEVVNMGLGLLATAIRTSSGVFKLIIWQVDAAGNLVRKGDATLRSQVTDLGIARIGPEYLVTGLRTATGTLKMVAWRLSVAGELTLLDEATGGVHSSLSLAPLGRALGVAASLRNAEGNLEVIAWQLNLADNSLNRTSEAGGGKTLLTRAVNQDVDRMVTAVRTSTGYMKLIVWATDDDGTLTRVGNGTDYDNGATAIAAARLGVDLIGTATITGSTHRLEVAAWGISADGTQVTKQQAVVSSLEAREVAAAQVDSGKLAVAATDSLGRLYVMVWQVPGLILP